MRAANRRSLNIGAERWFRTGTTAGKEKVGLVSNVDVIEMDMSTFRLVGSDGGSKVNVFAVNDVAVSVTT